MTDDVRAQAQALVEKVIGDHPWPECGFQGNNPSVICPMLKTELIAAIEAEIARERGLRR